MSYSLNVNGQTYVVDAPSPETPLLWVLRDILHLTGTKYGCGISVCWACTVLINGQADKSCDISVSSAVGQAITTIEGLANFAAFGRAGREGDGAEDSGSLGRAASAAVRVLPVGDAYAGSGTFFAKLVSGER